MTHYHHLHTRQHSFSAGIGESPNIHASSSQSSIFSNIRRNRAATNTSPVSSPDQTPLCFTVPDPPSNQIPQYYNVAIQPDQTHSHSFVASLARAPISSTQAQAWQTSSITPTYSYKTHPQISRNHSLAHSRTKSINLDPKPPCSDTASMKSVPDPYQFISDSAQHPSFIDAPPLTSTQHPQLDPPQDTAFARLRAMSFETVGGICGKYTDPRPRLYGRKTSRSVTFVNERPARTDEEVLPDTDFQPPRKSTQTRPARTGEEVLPDTDFQPPRKSTKTRPDLYHQNQQRSNSLEEIRIKCAAAKRAHRTHAQKAWEEMYQSRLERAQWRAEAEASCTTALFYHYARSSSDQRRPRPRPSSVSHLSDDAPHAFRKCRLLSSSRACKESPFSPNPQAARLKPLQHQATSSSSALPRRRKRAQTVGAALSTRPSLSLREHLPSQFCSSQSEAEEVVSPVVGRSFDLLFPFLTGNSSRLRHIKSNAGTLQAPQRPAALPSMTGFEEKGYRLVFPTSQDRSAKSRAKALRRSSSVPGIRLRRNPNLMAEQPLPIDSSPRATPMATHQSYRHPPFDSNDLSLPQGPRSSPGEHARDLLSGYPPSSSSRVARAFNSDNFQFFFQRSRSLRHQLVSQATFGPRNGPSLPSSSLDRPINISQVGFTAPLSQPILSSSSGQQSSHVDSQCDSGLAQLPPSDNIPLSGDPASNLSYWTVSGSAIDKAIGRPSLPSLKSSDQEGSKGPLYSLPLYVAPRTDSISPLPPPPRSKRGCSNRSSGSSRSRSKTSHRSETAERSPSRIPSRGSSRARVSFVCAPVPTVPALPASKRSTLNHLTPPHTPTRTANTTATNISRPEPIIVHNLPSAVASLNRIRTLSSPDPIESWVRPVSTTEAFRSFSPTSRSMPRVRPSSFSDESAPLSRSAVEPSTLGASASKLKDSTFTTATNIATPQPIITHNLPSAVATLDRIKRLSFPQSPSPRFLPDSGSRTAMTSFTPSYRSPDLGRPSTSASDPEPPTLEGCSTNNPKESLDSDCAPRTPDLGQSPGRVGRDFLMRGRQGPGRQRTVTELSGSSVHSESSHSVIDLDKYIDQADLFYQAPASPRRDLIKRYSEQMTDERRAQAVMCPTRKSRLIDEVLADYFDLAQKHAEQSEPMAPYADGGKSGAGEQTVSCMQSDLKVLSPNLKPSSKSSRKSLAPSIVDIYEARLSHHPQLSPLSDPDLALESN